jgi:hypothetical protein
LNSIVFSLAEITAERDEFREIADEFGAVPLNIDQLAEAIDFGKPYKLLH